MNAFRWFAATCVAAGSVVACGGKPSVEADAEACGVDRGEQGDPQILFGDLHVHSTDSIDARVLAGPPTGGDANQSEGPAQRCDFARFCSQLDFWSINDHPELAEPERYRAAIEAVRTCNALEGGHCQNPRMVTFMGWEWTNDGDDPASDFGHKNVIFREDDASHLPTRPVGASRALPLTEATVGILVRGATNADPDNASFYDALGASLLTGVGTAECPHGVDVHDLPLGCREIADDPAELFEKLDQWGFDALVIPHGTAWGTNHGPRSGWGAALVPAQHSERYERLFEVYSGHGSSEPHKAWRHVVEDAGGAVTCPAPTPEFEPCCWRAGEIERQRAAACVADPTSAACDAAAAAARQRYAERGLAGWQTQGGAAPEDWGDCGQCRDCFQPAFSLRPRFSAQDALASADLEDPAHPLRLRFGLIGSTDSHAAGAGAGYKEGKNQSDIIGAATPEFETLIAAGAPIVAGEWERQNNYWYSGGLVAVHSRGRSRSAIWSALQRREAYGTSGERMQLWFDLVNGPDGARHPMGSELTLADTPRFEVRAVGSFKQLPGCPESVTARAPAGFVDSQCMGECYNPSDERHLVTRVEVVKITPQIAPGEGIDALVTDPFASLPCPPDPEGCTVTFDDPAFVAGARPALYYVRAIQEPTAQLNADNLRCTRDASGFCTARLCQAGYAGAGDDCLAQSEERAWSSPIFVER